MSSLQENKYPILEQEVNAQQEVTNEEAHLRKIAISEIIGFPSWSQTSTYPINSDFHVKLTRLQLEPIGVKPNETLTFDFLLKTSGVGKESFNYQVFNSRLLGSPVEIIMNIAVTIVNGSREGTIDEPVPFGDGTKFHVKKVLFEWLQCVKGGRLLSTVTTDNIRTCTIAAVYSGLVGIAKQLDEPIVRVRFDLYVEGVPLIADFYPDILRVGIDHEFEFNILSMYIDSIQPPPITFQGLDDEHTDSDESIGQLSSDSELPSDGE